MTENPANNGAKITVHWLDRSRAHRLIWLMEELNLDYDIKIWKRTPRMTAPKELKTVHPLGKSPVIQVTPATEGAKPITIAESGTIVEYISEHFGKSLIPKQWKEGQEGTVGGETDEWMRYRYFMHYAEGSIMTLEVVSVVIDQIRDAPVPFFIKPIPRFVAGQVDSQFLNENFKLQFDFLENELATSGGDWFCGKNLTGVDFLMIFPVEAATDKAGITPERYPNLAAYIKRIHERPAYKRAVEKIESLTDAPIMFETKAEAAAKKAGAKNKKRSSKL